MAFEFASASGLCFLAELGDLSFFFTAVLSAWCPWRGARSGPGANHQRLAIAKASALALGARVMLRSMQIRIASMLGSGIGPMLAAALLLVLAGRAYLQRSKCETVVSQLADCEAKSTDVPEAGGFFLGSFKPYDPKAYSKDTVPWAGESVPLVQQAGQAAYSGRSGQEPAEPPPCMVSLAFAFALPLLVIFLEETGSNGVEVQVLQSGLSLANVLGGAVGIVVAIAVATLLGFVLEREVQDSALLVTVSSGLAAMGIFVLRTAALQMLTPVHGSPLGVRT